MDRHGKDADLVAFVKQLLVTMMRKVQLEHVCAANGRAALNAYCEAPDDYFLVLMDMSMPIMDGFTATARIRKYEEKKNLPRVEIVALTGVTDASAKARAFDCGVDDYMEKPVSMRVVMALIKSARSG